jgi:hypothetical protein
MMVRMLLLRVFQHRDGSLFSFLFYFFPWLFAFLMSLHILLVQRLGVIDIFVILMCFLLFLSKIDLLIVCMIFIQKNPFINLNSIQLSLKSRLLMDQMHISDAAPRDCGP